MHEAEKQRRGNDGEDSAKAAQAIHDDPSEDQLLGKGPQKNAIEEHDRRFHAAVVGCGRRMQTSTGQNGAQSRVGRTGHQLTEEEAGQGDDQRQQAESARSDPTHLVLAMPFMAYDDRPLTDQGKQQGQHHGDNHCPVT